MWTHRIILESLLQADNSFITLTYDPETVLWSEGYRCGLMTLRPKDLQDWIKRLRKRVHPLRIRYFGVGEYGDNSGRPHYHVAVFGYPRCRRGVSMFDDRGHCCETCDLVRLSWGFGNVVVGNLSLDSAQYVAGYVMKKWSKGNEALLGREPEFARMSSVPGIGRDALFEVASVMLQYDLHEDEPDVPSSLNHGRRSLPLGRYLRRQLRLMVGKDESAPAATVEAIAEELRPLYERAKALAKDAPRAVRWQIERSYFGELVVEAGEGAYNRMICRPTRGRKL